VVVVAKKKPSSASTPETSDYGRPIDGNMYTVYVVMLLAAVNAVNIVDRMVLSVLFPDIKADLALSDTQLGLLVGLAFSVFYAICAIPIAHWADRGIRRDIIVLGLATWSLMTALGGFVRDFPQLFLARVGVGAGEASCHPTASSLICDYVQLRHRSTAFVVFNLGAAIGVFVGIGLAGWLVKYVGWRSTLVLFGLPGLGLALLVRLTLREPARGRYDSARVERPRIRRVMRILWECRTYRILTLGAVVAQFGQWGLNQWWPSFYVRVMNQSVQLVGPSVGFVLGTGMTVGLIAGGIIAHRLTPRDIRSPLWIGGLAYALAAPIFVMSVLVSSVSMSLSLVFVAYVLVSIPTGPILSATYSVIDSSLRATAGSINLVLVVILGIGGGPLFVGVLSDLLTPRFDIEALRYALVAPAIILILHVPFLLAASRHLSSDLRFVSAEV